MEDIIRARAKYGVGGKCVSCGQPTDSASIRCDLCLDKVYLEEELAFTRDWLAGHPAEKIELAHDRGKLMHLVCFHCPRLGWCGAKLTQVRSKRRSYTAGSFPDGVCGACRGIYRDFACNQRDK